MVQQAELPKPYALSQKQRLLSEKLIRALDDRNSDIALQCMNDGALLGRGDPNGRTPLHYACANKLETVALAMIAKGAPLDTRDNSGRIPLYYACNSELETVALAMIDKGARVDTVDVWKNTQLHYAFKNDFVRLLRRAAAIAPDSLSTAHRNFQDNDVDDMLKEVIRLNILPALLLESDAGQVRDEDAEAFIDRVEKAFLPHLRHLFSDTPPLRPSAELSEEAMARLLHPMRLSRSWHHPGVTIPAELRPLRINRTWRAILPQPWHDPGTELNVVCLSDSDSLTQESNMLDHCVGYGGYDDQCCRPDEKRSHIFSTRDAEGHALSTVEAKYEYGQFIVNQHAGKDNATPPPQAQQAWDSFTQELETQPNLLTTEPLGEVRKDHVDNVPRIWRSIGFEPSWENIDRIFDEYRMPYRRASIPTKGRRMVYDDLVTNDGYKHPHHFISGYALADDRNVPIPGSFRQQRDDLPPREAGQHIVDLRDLDARSWLRATGLMEEIHRFIKENAQSLASPMRESQSEQPLHFRPIPTPQYKVREATEHNLGNPSKATPSKGFVRHSAADSSSHGISP